MVSDCVCLRAPGACFWVTAACMLRLGSQGCKFITLPEPGRNLSATYCDECGSTVGLSVQKLNHSPIHITIICCLQYMLQQSGFTSCVIKASDGCCPMTYFTKEVLLIWTNMTSSLYALNTLLSILKYPPQRRKMGDYEICFATLIHRIKWPKHVLSASLESFTNVRLHKRERVVRLYE